MIMRPTRRNTISHTNAWIVTGVAALAGILAALSPARPTGSSVPDAIVTFALGALVTWLSASAPWWALATAAGIVTVGSLESSVALIAIGAMTTLAALWIGYMKATMPVERAVLGGAIVSVALRIEMHHFFLDSAIVAGTSLGLLIVTGWMRRQSYVRRRIVWCSLGLLGLMLIGVAGMATAALRAKSDATKGYNHLIDGLDRLDATDMAGAADVLKQAAVELRHANESIDGPLTSVARFVPIVAQNRTATTTLLDRASTAADAASKALAVVDIDQLRIIDGRVDVGAVSILSGPLAQLKSTVDELSAALHDVDSPWLVAPLQNRLRSARDRVDRVTHLATGASATAQYAPDMLGAGGMRRYLFAFTNPSEARGVSGLMGNWSEVTIDRGQLRVTKSGRTAQLIQALRDGEGFRLDMPADYFSRYEHFGAGNVGVTGAPKFWSYSTISPDMPSDGSAMAQMYEAGGGQHLDGVFVIDPAGLAALLGATDSSITVDGVDQPLSATTIEAFLLRDQYQLPENDREIVLAAVTEQTIKKVLTSSLPAPRELIEKLSPAALGGHISVWAADPTAEAFLRTIGIDNALPDFSGPHGSADGLAVVTTNTGGNKIDSFLRRAISYSPTYSASNGDTNATLTVSLTNDAPTIGFPDYVIGNIIGLPTGTNRMLLSVYSRLGHLDSAIDGTTVPVQVQGELGWNVYSTYVNVPSGTTVVVTMHLSGRVAPGRYEVIYRPQALPTADTLTIDAQDSDHERIFDFSGILSRRSVLSASGVDAWRD
ncbi:MAG: DUF4012 domain-containing protein [Ilumatobacteraceae bacterium]